MKKYRSGKEKWNREQSEGKKAKGERESGTWEKGKGERGEREQDKEKGGKRQGKSDVGKRGEVNIGKERGEARRSENGDKGTTCTREQGTTGHQGEIGKGVVRQWKGKQGRGQTNKKGKRKN